MRLPSLRHPRPRLLAAAIAAPFVAVAVGACGSSSGAIPKTVRVADVAQAAVNPITVSPLPGTADASPSTQISFLGGAGTTVSDVRIVGSRSGGHGGKLEAYSTGTGESFIPTRPFVAGERVSVTVGSSRVDLQACKLEYSIVSPK